MNVPATRYSVLFDPAAIVASKSSLLVVAKRPQVQKEAGETLYQLREEDNPEKLINPKLYECYPYSLDGYFNIPIRGFI